MILEGMQFTVYCIGNIFKNEQIYSKKTNINLKIINPRNRLNKNLKLV